MSAPRILIAGVGNIFLGDDAFGVEVAQRLAQAELPVGVRVVDFGIRGLDLAYTLLEGYDAVVLVDAVPRGGAPGTLYTIEPDLAAERPARDEPLALPEGHRMDPANMIRFVELMGGRVERLLLVGCEPTPIDQWGDVQGGLSSVVERAVPQAMSIVLQLVAQLTEQIRQRPPVPAG